MAIITKEDLIGPLYAISDDLERAERDSVFNDDSYSRRNYIRVLFACINLGIYLLKRTVLVAASSKSDPLTFAELVLLREQTFSLEKNGEVRMRNKFLGLAENLRFTTRCVEKGFGISLTFDSGGKGWDAFKRAIKIRDRITHPKTYQDLDVTDEEIELAKRVGTWFSEFLTDWFGKFVPTIKPVYEITDKKIDWYVM
jgi:hypothetical protein